MKIAMILPSLANTGPGIVAKDLCTGLIRTGHICKVFFFDSIFELEMPCDVEQIKLSQSINFCDWDVIHSHMFRPDYYVWYHTLFLPRKTLPILISTLHNPIGYRALRTNYNCVFSIAGFLLWPFFLKAFDSVVVLNNQIYQEIRGIKRNKLQIIFNGRDIVLKTSISNKHDEIIINELRKKYIIIGTISSISKRKGLEQIVKALVKLHEFAFVAVGDGPELEHLKVLSEELGVSKQCCWIGYRSDSVDYQSLFDIFIMCTRSEGFPLALVEAAAYGKPTVLSNISILKSLISDNEV
ncbi:glycosyltransferase, partial [Bacteroides bouchesdurhonensis]